MNGGAGDAPAPKSTTDATATSRERASVSRRSLLTAGGAVGGILALSPLVWQATEDRAPDSTGGESGDGSDPNGPDGAGPGDDAGGDGETDGDAPGDDGEPTDDDGEATDDATDDAGGNGYGAQGYGESGYGG